MATKRFYESVGQEVIEETLENGLRIVILPKPGFQTRFASFTTKYGGMDNGFRSGGAETFETMPAGIAHFLEHKLFEQEDGSNVLDLYSRMGADCNAFTSKNRTAYIFSVTDDRKFTPALDLLIKYVQAPYFTDENVAKEQGIIQQEIASGLDRPVTVAYMEFEAALYHRHPAGVSIIGTAESVGRITKEHLYKCHETFYHPANMMVVVAGDVDPDSVIDLVRKDMESRDYPKDYEVERPAVDEPASVRQANVTKAMKVSRPIVLIGYKGPVSKEKPSPDELQRRRLLGNLVGDAFFGRTSEWYWDLYGKGILTREFSYGFTDYGTACHILIYGETEDQDAFVKSVSEGLEGVARDGVPEEDFELARRAAVGRLLSTLDNPEDIALRFVGDMIDDIDSLKAREVLESLTAQDATDFLRTLVGPDRKVISTITPLGGEEGK